MAVGMPLWQRESLLTSQGCQSQRVGNSGGNQSYDTVNSPPLDPAVPLGILLLQSQHHVQCGDMRENDAQEGELNQEDLDGEIKILDMQSCVTD